MRDSDERIEAEDEDNSARINALRRIKKISDHELRRTKSDFHERHNQQDFLNHAQNILTQELMTSDRSFKPTK